MGSLVCTIELSTDNGVTITVDNANDKIKQTIVMDGTQIKITCLDTSGSVTPTSSITMIKDTITVECKNYNVNAEAITCKSTKDTTHHADGKMDVDSTGAMTIKTSDALTVQATNAAKISSDTNNVTVQASAGDAKLDAMTVTCQASTDAKLHGLNTTVKADVQLQLQGTQAKLAGDAMAEVNGGGMLKLGGAVVQMQGQPEIMIG